jgi:hypothetical protein
MMVYIGHCLNESVIEWAPFLEQPWERT